MSRSDKIPLLRSKSDKPDFSHILDKFTIRNDKLKIWGKCDLKHPNVVPIKSGPFLVKQCENKWQVIKHRTYRPDIEENNLSIFYVGDCYVIIYHNWLATA